jgi:hypothetical protein
MPLNDFLPFGTGVGANVLSQVDYQALSARLAGFSPGLAQSGQLNKVWRQSAFISAGLAQVVSDVVALDLLDDGNIANLAGRLRVLMGVGVTTLAVSTALNASQAGLILCSAASGNVVLTLPAAAVAANAALRYTIIRTDSSANTLTVQRAGADTIEGATSLLVRNTSPVVLIGNGAAAWFILSGRPGRFLGVQQFLVSGTYTPTPGTARAIVSALGGGGAGGGASATAAGGVSLGGPGGSGAFGRGLYNITGTVVITIGAGGAGVSSAPGNPGGTTSFGAVLTAPGGPGGSFVTAIAANVVAITTVSAALPTGANMLAAGGGSGSASIGLTSGAGAGGGGGASVVGPGAAGQSVNSVGNPAGSLGGGGGGCVNIGAGTNALTGGAGLPGLIIVEEYT